MGFVQKLKGSADNLHGETSDSAGTGTSTLSGSETSAALQKYVKIRSFTGTSISTMSKVGLGDVVYIVYFILGTGFLLPWNAFITAIDYFGNLYPSSQVDRTFSVAYMIPCFLSLVLILVYGQQFGARARINLGLGLFFISIVVVPLMGALFINGQKGSSWTFLVTVSAVAVTGIGDALVQATLIGSAGHLPQRYLQAIVAGTGFSGVFVSFLRIVTKYAFPDTRDGLRSSANIYFTVSAVFLGICVLSYNYVHQETVEMINTANSEDGEVEGLTTESDLDRENTTPIVAYETEASRNVMAQKFSFKQIFIQVKWLAASMALTYVITLAIFPGFLTEDVKSDILGDWYPVLLIGSYNVGDLVGKSLPVEYIPSKQVIGFAWAATRLLFFPLYSACIHGPQVFRTETPVFVLTVMLGITNGYMTTSLFVAAPKNVKRGALDAEIAGIVMLMALESGLTMGSLLSWVWVV